jgi:hypothetical protein
MSIVRCFILGNAYILPLIITRQWHTKYNLSYHLNYMSGFMLTH